MEIVKNAAITFLLGISVAYAETPCPFDKSSNSYTGTKTVQASCLLRQVQRFGKLAQEIPLPNTIASNMAKVDIDFTLAEFKNYLLVSNIKESDIGGALNTPLNPKTSYFIIHDTSTPNFHSEPFPENIDKNDWNYNNLANYSQNAHVFVNRVGASITKVDFSLNYRTTKFELLDSSRRDLYIGVELIQPRRSYPDGTDKNDAAAPPNGFTPEQLDRLAVTYLAASLRAGKYLVPAFHSVVDAGLKDGHDDPQNFNLSEWDAALTKVLEKIKMTTNVEVQQLQPPSKATLVCNDYASWRKVNEDCSWSNAAKKASDVSTLSLQNPSDIASFCPNYSNLDQNMRNKFWVGLLSAIARPESNYKPDTTYTENFNDGSGKKVISRGLLQISIESANQKRYSCGIKQSKDLQDSPVNLTCGIKILEYWVVNDQVIASYKKGVSRGGGRYWSVLRKANNHLPEIIGNTSSLAFCKK